MGADAFDERVRSQLLAAGDKAREREWTVTTNSSRSERTSPGWPEADSPIRTAAPHRRAIGTTFADKRATGHVCARRRLPAVLLSSQFGTSC
jgi:hypothetical protein